MMNTWIGAGLIGMAAFLATAAVDLPATYHVDPEKGDDGGDGSGKKPFRTIERARDAVRRINANMQQDIVVSLRGGRYQLADTIVFDSRDSGTNGHKVIYRAEPGQTPLISGGVRLEKWTKAGKGLYKASAKGLRFRQLYINGQRGVRARYPNDGEYARLRNWNTDRRLIEVEAGDVPKFTSDAGNPVEFIAQVRWTAWRAGIDEVEREDGKAFIKLLNPAGDMIFNKPHPPKYVKQAYHLENAYEFLDQPGEWFLRTSTDEVFYLPRPGEDMAKVEVIAPKVTTLMRVAGTLNEPVHDLVFAGIAFEDTNWLVPDKLGHVDHQANQINKAFPHRDDYRDSSNYHTEAAVMLDAAQRVTITGCVFRNLGAVGIDLVNGCRENAINGNRFSDIANNAINNGSPAVNLNRSADARAINKGNRFSNNFITRIGLDYSGAIGICSAYAQGEVIEHNEIINVPYTAISEGWGWSLEKSILGNTTVRKNHIMRYNAFLTDGGGIYTLSRQDGTVIEGNYIQDVWFSKYADTSCMAPIYLDEGSSYITVHSNVVNNTMGFINGTIAEHVGKGSKFDYNDSQDPAIIANAGLQPEYLSLRTFPVPSSWAGIYKGKTKSIGFSYAPGWDIHYTLDGSEPTEKSPTYKSPIEIRPGPPVTIKVIAINASGQRSEVLSGTYSLENVFEETFGDMKNGPMIEGHTRTPQRSKATGFTWVAWTPKQGPLKPGSDGVLENEDEAVRFDIGAGPHVLFICHGPQVIGNTPGAYAYAIFSSKGNTSPTTSARNMAHGTFRAMFDGGAASWAKGIQAGPPWPEKVRILARDTAGVWYLSTPKTAYLVEIPGVHNIPVQSLAWEKLSPESQKLLNSTPDPDATRGVLTTETKETVPDLSEITGWGIYIHETANEASYFRLQHMGLVQKR